MITDVKDITARIVDEMQPLIDYFTHFGKFQWIRNPGNAGDGLIAHGTKDLFFQHYLRFVEVTRDTIIPGRPLVYGGGGAWCRAFGIGPEIVLQAAAVTDTIIVLPSTFEEGKLNSVKHLAGRLKLWSRDLVGLDLARKAGFDDAEFCHDLAFAAPVPRVPTDRLEMLAAFRRDVIGCRNPPDLAILNPHGRLVVADVSRFGTEYDTRLFDDIGRASTVHTDRTHVAIASAMMGRETFLYRNGSDYHKNESIFAASLSRFPKCRFVR